MSAMLVVDAATVSTTLSNIARAVYAIDDYYAPLRQAFLHGGKASDTAGPLDQLVNQMSLQLLNQSIADWYGIRRDAIAASATAPFGQEAGPAFEIPLSSLIAIDHAVRAAGGIASAEQLEAARGLFASVEGWMRSVVEALNGSVATFHAIIGELGTLERLSTGPYADDGSDVLELFHRSLGLDQAAQTAIGDLLIAWTVVRDLAADIAGRLAAAEARQLGSVLQSLDLSASLKEWARVRDIAAALKPAPPRG